MAYTAGTPYELIEEGVYSVLMTKFNLAQTCGFLANIYEESKFNPNAYNGNDKGAAAYGLCQWRSDRLNDLKLYAKLSTVHLVSVPWNKQVEFIFYELQGKEKKTFNSLQNINNDREGARNAGRVVSLLYERPAGKHVAADHRGNIAVKFFDHYTKYPASILPIGDLTPKVTPSPSSPTYYGSLSTIDPHKEYISKNLSRVEAAGYDCGYLIDMTNGGEFKFYVPEFSESAGANWGDIDIPGRSVTIKSYQSTSSRSIEISLDLYAGVGFYSSSGDGDVVGKLHRDANFIKSLEYPDYSNAITRPPATVHLILNSAVNLVGIVSNVSVEHLKPVDSQNRSMYLKVTFTVTQHVYNPPGYKDIRENSYAMTSTENPSTILNQR